MFVVCMKQRQNQSMEGFRTKATLQISHFGCNFGIAVNFSCYNFMYTAHHLNV